MILLEEYICYSTPSPDSMSLFDLKRVLEEEYDVFPTPVMHSVTFDSDGYTVNIIFGIQVWLLVYKDNVCVTEMCYDSVDSILARLENEGIISKCGSNIKG